MSMWQLRLLGWEDVPLGGKRFPWLEVFILSPLLLMLRLGRLSFTPKAKAGWEQGAEPCSPGSQVT